MLKRQVASQHAETNSVGYIVPAHLLCSKRTIAQSGDYISVRTRGTVDERYS